MNSTNNEINDNGKIINGYLGINIKMSCGNLPPDCTAIFSEELLKNKNSCSLNNESEQHQK